MNCPCCDSTSGVAESRRKSGTMRRRRWCHACAHRWWTIEIEEDAALPPSDPEPPTRRPLSRPGLVTCAHCGERDAAHEALFESRWVPCCAKCD